jgi:hypothetical protein
MNADGGPLMIEPCACAHADAGHPIEGRVALDGVDEIDDRPLGFTRDRGVESTIERLVGADRSVGSARHHQRLAAAQPLDQPVGVPHPAGEERDADDARRERHGLVHDRVGIAIEVTRRGVDDAHLAAAREQRCGDILEA